MYSNTRFQQLLEALPRGFFDRTVEQLGAGRYDKSFKPYSHLVALLYGQFSGARSLRELETGFNARGAHHYHLGVSPVRRATLSDANARRSPELFKALLEQLMGHVQGRCRREIRELVYLLDSTPIQLKGYGFDWAGKGATRRTRGLKAHLLLAEPDHLPAYLNLTSANVNDVVDARRVPLESGATYVMDKGYCDYGLWDRIDRAGATFVTRFKANAALEVSSVRQPVGEGILDDARVTFRHRHNRARHTNPYHGRVLRRITVHREGETPLVLATNDLTRPAAEIAALYRQRWQIELFFKWLKQHLKIKRFLGRSRNAVLLQIYAALIGYLLLWLYRARAGQTRTELYLVLAELRETLFIRIPTERQRQYRRRRQQKAQLFARLQTSLTL